MNTPFARFSFAVLVILALAPAGCSRHAATGQSHLQISSAVLATLIRAEAPVTLFDARTGSHDDGRRIPGATSLAPDAPADEIAKRVGSKDRLIVTYCKDPACPNFVALAAHLRQLGYKNVLENPAGIEGWVASGFDSTMDPARAQGNGAP